MKKAKNLTGNRIVTKKRKIQKITGSYYVCLPLEFIKKHHLKPGDEVAVISDTICKVVPMNEI